MTAVFSLDSGAALRDRVCSQIGIDPGPHGLAPPVNSWSAGCQPAPYPCGPFGFMQLVVLGNPRLQLSPARLPCYEPQYLRAT